MRWAVVLCRLQNVVKYAATDSDVLPFNLYVTNECTWQDSFEFLETVFDHAKEENLIDGGRIVHSKISVSFYGKHT